MDHAPHLGIASSTGDHREWQTLPDDVDRDAHHHSASDVLVTHRASIGSVPSLPAQLAEESPALNMDIR